MLSQKIFMGLFSLMLIIYIVLDLVFRKEIKFLETEGLDLTRYEKYFLLSIFLAISKIIKKPGRLISQDCKKAIKYFKGIKYYRFYESLHLAKKIFVTYFFLAFASLVIGLTNKLVIVIGAIFMSFLLNYLMDVQVSGRYQLVKDRLKLELPLTLTRLALLIDSGLAYRRAIEIVAYSSNGILTGEIQKVLLSIENGAEEREAYVSLASFSEDILIKKFISLIVQNIYKGTEDFSKNLNLLKLESLNIRKSFIIDRSQKAMQKLLLPNLMIFSGIMVMVMVPVILNIL